MLFLNIVKFRRLWKCRYHEYEEARQEEIYHMQLEPAAIAPIIYRLYEHYACIRCIQYGAKHILEGGGQELVHVHNHGHEAAGAEAYDEIALNHFPYIFCYNYFPIANSLDCQ